LGELSRDTVGFLGRAFGWIAGRTLNMGEPVQGPNRRFDVSTAGKKIGHKDVNSEKPKEQGSFYGDGEEKA